MTSSRSSFFDSPKLQRWLYNTSLLVVMVFFIGFSAVLPIDSISKAASTSSNNYALNTFVIVGALVLFGITAAFITSARIYSRRLQLLDIPKRYVPLDENDLPKSCFRKLNKNFQRCEEIRKKAMFVNENIKHPGLSNPNSTVLPPSLSFEDVVRAVGMKLKWDQNLVGTEITIPKNLSFREIVAYLENKMKSMDGKMNNEFVELYEDLRYSGKLITEDKFIKFMEFSIEFVKNARISINNEAFDTTNHSRRHGSGSMIYPPSELSRSTMDGLSAYSVRDRSRSSIHPVGTFGSQGLSNLFYDEVEYDPNVNEFNDPLYRPGTYSSLSSAATTTRHYGL